MHFRWLANCLPSVYLPGRLNQAVDALSQGWEIGPQTASSVGPDPAHIWPAWISHGPDVGRIWAKTMLLSGTLHPEVVQMIMENVWDCSGRHVHGQSNFSLPEGRNRISGSGCTTGQTYFVFPPLPLIWRTLMSSVAIVCCERIHIGLQGNGFRLFSH